MMVKFETSFIVVVFHILCTCQTQTLLDEEIESDHYELTLIGIGIQFDEYVDYKLFPPASITAAIAINKYLWGNNTSEEFHENLSTRFEEIRNSQHGKATIDNIIICSSNEELETENLEFIAEKYKCENKEEDFENRSTEILNYVNKWVSEHTDNKINKFEVAPYPSTTDFVWIESSVFNFGWRNRFSRYFLKRGDFESYGKIIKVVYMTRRKLVQYYEDPSKKFRAIGLPFKGNEFSIYFVLPEKGEALDSLLLDYFNVDDFIEISNSSKILVNYKIPKMKLKYADIEPDFDLSYGSSDSTSSEGIDINLQGVLELEINEKGISALQVYSYRQTRSDEIFFDEFDNSEIVDYGEIAEERQDQETLFEVNRPFLFYIQHRNTKLIVLTGFVNNPRVAQT